jgi:hypothetical protein
MQKKSEMKSSRDKGPDKKINAFNKKKKQNDKNRYF